MTKKAYEWDTRIFSIPMQRGIVERRAEALAALTREYGNDGFFRETEAYRGVLRDANFRWCEPSINLRTLWAEGLLSRRYSGAGNIYYYRVAEGSLDYLKGNLNERRGNSAVVGQQLALL
ncbi:MAG: hypothetical protein V1836_04175 [Candidatus Aenigmatarchaeota archaeon]